MVTLNDFMRIHVLWAHRSVEGERIADLISQHFDGLGMERDGVAYRIPVRFHSKPWIDGDDVPAEIDLERSEHNVVVLLHDPDMAATKTAWNTYVDALRKRMDSRAGRDWYVPFGNPEGGSSLPVDSKIQYARRDRWKLSLSTQQARDNRLLLHLLHAVRSRLRAQYGSSDKKELLFISHAKADGDETAQAIVNYVNHTSQDVPLKTFYDAKELAPGDDYEKEFEDTIVNGTLLAIISDVYDSRPWCIFELTTAKRARRPIVLADIGKVRTSRTFPYGANLPRIRVSPDVGYATWIEPLLVETMSEGLRCDVFAAQADRAVAAAGIANTRILPRPPELFDLTELDYTINEIIYPDPPLGKLESDILLKAAERFDPKIQFKTLSEVE